MKSALKRDKVGVPSQRLQHRRRRSVVPAGKGPYQQKYPCFGSPVEFPVDKVYMNED